MKRLNFSFLLSAFSICLFSLLWVDLVRQLSYTWETNEQYAYGWFVPFLALGLFIRRWLGRPFPLRLGRGEGQGEVSPDFTGRNFLISAFVLLLCLLLLPLRVILEINQDWPLITWLYTLVVVFLTLYAIHLADPKSVVSGQRSVVSSPWSLVSGQRSEAPSPISAFRFLNFRFSPWLRHFAFPICFILVAVQWPYRIEHGLTQNLMQVVASLTVEIMGWFNIPAFQRGNLIELSTGVVGVDEACSGIRSFQSTLMAALFLGELYRLRMPIRLLLVGAGLTTAFLLNVCRTLILTWQANAHGLSAIDKWHDPAGFTITVACFAVLWLLAILIKKRWSAPDSQLSTFNSQPSTLNHQPSTSAPFQPSALSLQPSFPRRYLLAVGLWSLLCIGATEVWYRSHALRREDTAQWWVSYPTNLPSFQPVTVSKAAAKMLRHDVESGGSWDEPDGTKWSVYCFRWKEGDPTARMSAQAHRPEYCLVGGGHDLIAMSGTQFFTANAIALPFRLYTFDRVERPLHVFFCLWEDGAETQVGFGKTKQGDRLRTVWAGRRGLGQQTLEIICSGYPDLDAAEKAVRERLPQLIRVENQRTQLTAGGGP